jgi:hypothetical protein
MKRLFVALLLPVLSGCAFLHSMTQTGAQEEVDRYNREYAIAEKARTESDAADAKRAKEIREDKDKQRREGFVNAHPKLSKKNRAAILTGDVIAGMAPDQVTASWNEPERKNRTVGKWGTNEQWIYGSTYIYFENGIVTSWQDSQ